MPVIDIEKRYFLKCPTCNFLTEIKSESVNYCFNCTRKFKDNFKEWNYKTKKDIGQYKLEKCISYTLDEVHEFVHAHNRKHEIKQLTREQEIRRAYLKEGVPLDRGIISEWTLKEQIKSKVWVLILLTLVVLLAYFLK